MDIVVLERLLDKFGMQSVVIGIVSWGIWQLLKPIIANINESTKILFSLSIMLSEHNQRAIDMHQTCQTHGEYLCDAKDLLNNNREVIMLKLGAMHKDIESLGRE